MVLTLLAPDIDQSGRQLSAAGTDRPATGPTVVRRTVFGHLPRTTNKNNRLCGMERITKYTKCSSKKQVLVDLRMSLYAKLVAGHIFQGFFF